MVQLIALTNQEVGRCRALRLTTWLCSLLVVAIFLVNGRAEAQGFSISGTCSSPQRTTLSLTIYDGDSTFRTMSTVAAGTFQFSGHVKSPVLASIAGSMINGTLYFYLENSEITIALNFDNPSSSPINGSRTNSQFRYDMESCSGGSDVKCVSAYVQNNATSIFAPFLFYDRLLSLPVDEQQKLFARLQGDARHTYHYHLLATRMRRSHQVEEGGKMPDFTFVDDNGRLLHFDSIRSLDGCNVLLVGTTWCEQCKKAESQLKEMAVSSHFLYIDRQPQQWDAPCIQMLLIDHVPYIILIDREGKIASRDLRIWELTRQLPLSGCSSK